MSELNNTSSIDNDATTGVPRVVPVDYLYFTIFLFCFVIGIVGNGLALRYFLTKKRDVAASVYIFVASADIIVCALMLPVCVAMITDNRYGWILENEIFCNFWGVLWYVFSLGSIFLVAMLSITRTMHLVWPFRQQSRNAVTGVIVAYFTFLFVESSIPLWTHQSYEYQNWTIGICSWRMQKVLGENTVAVQVYNQIYLFQAYFPIFPIIISCGMTIKSLRRSDNAVLNRSNRAISVTIVMFTILFIMCNVPPVFLFLVVTIEKRFGPFQWTTFDYKYSYFYKFSVVMTVCINSALNSVLYFYRMKNMRCKTKDFLSSFKRKLAPPLLGQQTEDTYVASPKLGSRNI